MSLNIRTMTAADVPAGMRLKALAGWNQTEADWLRFLRSSPAGCFVAEWRGQVAGTVTTIVYEERFAWIGMVLVDPAFRSRGIGTALLERAIDYLDARAILCLKLDATPQGRPLYERMGFQAEYEIERCILEREASEIVKDATRAHAVELQSVFEMDREVFGADRSELLKSIVREAPEYVIVAGEGSAVSGYALGREGSAADHLGPWVASNASMAREVLELFLQRSRRETVFVDVVRDNHWAPQLVSERGFRLSRPLTRMYRGHNRNPGRIDRLCAILGPEFG
jgi:GNAT superfamily N-acetyltransferase